MLKQENSRTDYGAAKRVVKRAVNSGSALGRRQQGGIFLPILLAILAGAIILVVVKVFPVVYDGMSVRKMFDEMSEDEQFKDGADKRSILKYIERSLLVNQIRYLKKDQVSIKKNSKKGYYVVTLNYDQSVGLLTAPEDKMHGVLDASILLSFRNQAQVRIKR